MRTGFGATLNPHASPPSRPRLDSLALKLALPVPEVVALVGRQPLLWVVQPTQVCIGGCVLAVRLGVVAVRRGRRLGLVVATGKEAARCPTPTCWCGTDFPAAGGIHTSRPVVRGGAEARGHGRWKWAVSCSCS